MRRNDNLIGPNVTKFRCQRGWTQGELIAKLRSVGCPITLEILANIEMQRCAVTDVQLAFFAEIFCVSVEKLFDVD